MFLRFLVSKEHAFSLWATSRAFTRQKDGQIILFTSFTSLKYLSPLWNVWCWWKVNIFLPQLPLRQISSRSFPLCLQEGEALRNSWANLMAIYFPAVIRWRELLPFTLLARVWPRVGVGEIAKLAESYSHYSGREVLCQISSLNKFTVQSGEWPCLSKGSLRRGGMTCPFQQQPKLGRVSYIL